MKKIFLLLSSALILVAASSIKADAQVTSLKSQYGNVTDTATNTAKALTLATPIIGYHKVVTVVFQATEISGTTGGSAQVQGSLDGTIWYNIGSAYTLTDVASQVTSFTISDWGSVYLRLLVTPTGTMSDKIEAKVLARKL